MECADCGRLLSDPGAKVTMVRNSTWTLSNLCRGKAPPPSFPMVSWPLVLTYSRGQVSQALPTLARLIYYQDDEVLTGIS